MIVATSLIVKLIRVIYLYLIVSIEVIWLSLLIRVGVIYLIIRFVVVVDHD